MVLLGSQHQVIELNSVRPHDHCLQDASSCSSKAALYLYEATFIIRNEKYILGHVNNLVGRWKC